MTAVKKNSDISNSEAATKTAKVNVYAYNSALSFLRDWTSWLKTDRQITLQSIAQSAGVAKSALTMALQARRPLTSKFLRKLLPHIELSKSEQNFLLCLIQLDEAQSPDEYLLALKRAHRFVEYQRLNPLEIETFHYFTNWHYVAIRELSALEGFQLDAKWIQNHLRTPFTLQEIRRALDFLIAHEFIKVDEHGQVSKPDRKIECSPGVLRPALAMFHQEMLKMASGSIVQTESAFRNITSYTCGIPLEKFEEVREILDSSRDRLIALTDGYTHLDSLYHFSFVAFPLSNPQMKKESEDDSSSNDP